MTDHSETTVRSRFLADLEQLRPALHKKLWDMTELEWKELSRGIADILDRAKKEFSSGR
jgi:hypothetical protein